MQHPGVKLDALVYGRLKQKALALVQAELEAQYEPDPSYKVLHKKHGFSVATQPVPDSAFKKLRSSGTCHDTSLDEVQYALYTSDAVAYRNYLAVLYAEHYLEGAILNTTLSATEQDPFLWFGVKYMKVHLPGKAAFEPRDATYVEYTGTTRNLRGEKVLFVVRETQEFPEIPPFYEVVRFQFQVVQLFTQHHDGRVTYSFVTFSDPNGSMPAWLYHKQAYSEMNMDEKLPPLVTMRRLLERKPRDAPKMTVKDKACRSCHAPFTVFRTKATCYVCTHNMCKKCRVTVISPLHVKGLVPSEKRHFCKSCVIDTRLLYPGYGTELRSKASTIQESPVQRSASAPEVEIPAEWGVDQRFGLSTSSAPPSVLEDDECRGESSLYTETQRASSFYDDSDMRETFEAISLSLDNQKQLLSDMQRQFVGHEF
ncbi:hypothetical protein ACHHYP_00668 [Achlya hypogyna]|uniref:FYVE-type domain-containing protein n=1 Tax=Achlya hypogyna TaxID=1202772 RepID=A0A1V9ZU50_ACHHY|nr:hypothetical protein ACHHYP_00668 [Achlya hypogyna]